MAEVPDSFPVYDGQRQEVRLAGLAGRQHGVVSFAQIRSLGLSESFVERAVAAGRLHRVYRGVYAVGHRNVSQPGRFMAAVLACGPGAVLSHRSAAVLWGIASPRSGPVHVTHPKSRRSRRGLHLHQSRFAAGDVRIWWGVRVTSPQRTLVDLADVCTTGEVDAALSECHRLGLLERSELRAHHPGRKGLGAVLRLGQRMTRSQIERRFLADIRAAGDIALPSTNHEMHGFEADLYWPAHALVVEIDDYSTHGERRAFERDRRKQTAYALAGIQIVRITEETLPGAVGTVRLLLDASTARSRRG